MTGRSVTGRKAVMASPGPPCASQPGKSGRLRFNRAGAPKYRVHSDLALSEEHTVTLILSSPPAITSLRWVGALTRSAPLPDLCIGIVSGRLGS